MTPIQRELARHALGLRDGRKVSYRNRFTAAPGVNDRDWEDMVAAGLAERGEKGLRYAIFHLTYAGATAALQPGERLDPEDFPEVGQCHS